MVTRPDVGGGRDGCQEGEGEEGGQYEALLKHGVQWFKLKFILVEHSVYMDDYLSEVQLSV